MEFLKLTVDTALERRPDELIAAILLATVLSVATAGLYRLLKRRVNDSAMLMATLMIPATCLAMAMAAGYVARNRATPAGFNASPAGSPIPGRRQIPSPAPRQHAAWHPAIKDATGSTDGNPELPPG